MIHPPLKDPVSRVVIEQHSKRRPHQKEYARILGQKGKDPEKHLKCDVYGCGRCTGSRKVARALSREFRVDNSKHKIKSRIVLAEVNVADYPSVAAAKKAVRAIAQPVRPLSIEILNHTKRPVECGYSEQEVFDALLPYTMRHARHYSNYHCPTEDAVQQGWVGVRMALISDVAVAPIASHAFLHIRTNIRRFVAESSLIRKGEREGDFFGNKGGQIIDPLGKTWECKDCKARWVNKAETICPQCDSKSVKHVKIYGHVTSADAELGDSFSMKDAIASEEPGPAEIVTERDNLEKKREILQNLIKAADLSDQQLEVLVNQFGLNGTHGLSGTDTATKLDISRQRVGQQRKKCIEKLQRAAEDLGYDWELLEKMFLV